MTHPANLAVEAVIVDAIINQPRSQQTLIGPSEIGTDCLRCLARKLAGIQRFPAQGVDDLPWLPFLGTSMHAMLEGFFEADNSKRETPRWLIENRVNIGKIGDQEITGSCDLFDLETQTVIDHKLVGATKLKKVAKGGPGAMYRIQAHLYGYGWTRQGQEVKDVAVKFYPRNNITMTAGAFWHEPYDERIAVAAMARANEIFEKVQAAPDLNEYLRTLPTDSECFSCSEYPSVEPQTEQVEDDLFTQPTPFNKR